MTRPYDRVTCSPYDEGRNAVMAIMVFLTLFGASGVLVIYTVIKLYHLIHRPFRRRKDR